MMRLRRFLLLTVFAAVGFGAYAGFTAADALKSAPSLLLGPLSKAGVADLVEYANAGMLSHAERNAVGADARILALDSVHAELQTGPGRVLTFELLPLKGDTVIAVIETLTSQMTDSRMTVYSRSWQPRPKLWKEPEASAWGRLDEAEAPILMAEYSYSPATQILTLTNTSETKAQLTPQLRYKWTSKGFRRIKE